MLNIIYTPSKLVILPEQQDIAHSLFNDHEIKHIAEFDINKFSQDNFPIYID